MCCQETRNIRATRLPAIQREVEMLRRSWRCHNHWAIRTVWINDSTHKVCTSIEENNWTVPFLNNRDIPTLCRPCTASNQETRVPVGSHSSGTLRMIWGDQKFDSLLSALPAPSLAIHVLHYNGDCHLHHTSLRSLWEVARGRAFASSWIAFLLSALLVSGKCTRSHVSI